MSKVDKALRKAFEEMESKKWDTIYVLVDFHGTVIKCHEGDEPEFYDKAIPVLKAMSDRRDITLIAWTGSHDSILLRILDRLWKRWGIHVKYVNQNPEIMSSDHYNASSGKLYFNVGIDDRFGFEQRDWNKLMKVLKHHPYKNKNNE